MHSTRLCAHIPPSVDCPGGQMTACRHAGNGCGALLSPSSPTCQICNSGAGPPPGPPPQGAWARCHNRAACHTQSTDGDWGQRNRTRMLRAAHPDQHGVTLATNSTEAMSESKFCRPVNFHTLTSRRTTGSPAFCRTSRKHAVQAGCGPVQTPTSASLPNPMSTGTAPSPDMYEIPRHLQSYHSV